MPRHRNDEPYEEPKAPQESTKAKIACDLYLSMGPDRSMAKVVEQLGRPPGYRRMLETWSSQYHWAERARKYDDEQLKRKQKSHQKALDDMNDRHAQIAITQQKVALEVIQRLKQIKGKGGIGAIAAVQLLKLSTDLERIARGASTEQIALVGNKDADPVDITVETFWGRGTDPRRKAPEDTAQAETSEEDPEVDADFDSDVEEDAWEDSDEE